MKSILELLNNIEKGVLVSNSSERQNVYGVGATGLVVNAFDGDNNEMFGLIVGNNGPDFVSSYVRLSDSDKVYLLNESLLGAFSISADDWKVKGSVNKSTSQ